MNRRKEGSLEDELGWGKAAICLGKGCLCCMWAVVLLATQAGLESGNGQTEGTVCLSSGCCVHSGLVAFYWGWPLSQKDGHSEAHIWVFL